MAVFTYTALGADGRSTTGTLPADTRAQAIAAVIGKGLHPVKVEEQGSKKATSAKASEPTGKPGRVTQKNVEAFTRELASLLSGGVPLARGRCTLRARRRPRGPGGSGHRFMRM